MEIARIIDYTLLKADCTEGDIKSLCEEALKHNYKAICIPPYFVKYASSILSESETIIATVVGYPFGYSATPAKVEEIKRAIDEGAHELDVVVNASAIKSGDWYYVKNDINSMTLAAHLKGKAIKIVLESCFLTKAELLRGCEICKEVGVNYVQVATGRNEAPKIETIQFLKANLGDKIKIKVFGGIQSLADVEKYIAAGAARVGCHVDVKLME